MKKVLYCSPESFIDVDMPVLRSISNKVNLLWIVILDQENFYNKEDIKVFCKQNNIECKVYIRSKRKSNPLNLLMASTIIKQIKKFNPDVYYFEQFDNPYLTLLVSLLLPKRKIIVGVHDITPHKNHLKLMAHYHRKFYFNFFKNYHVFSKEQAKVMVKLHAPEKTFTIPLNLKGFGQSTVNKKNDFPKFLFFGKIHYYKGLDILIEAVNKIPKEYKYEVTIAGFCKDFEEYKSKIKNDVYNYKICLVKNEEIPNLFLSHDYLVLPYRDVTQSGPLHIAYYYGIPAIASDLGGFKEYINHEKTGYLFESESSEDLSKKMIEIMNTHTTSYKMITSNLKSFVDNNISEKAIGKKYLEMFNEI